MVREKIPVSARLSELIELLGDEAVQKIIHEWGGIRLYIPHRFRPNHPLVQKLGVEASSILMQNYCGETLSIPKKLYASTKKAEIIDGLLAGKTQSGIAREVDVSQRYVEKVAALIRG